MTSDYDYSTGMEHTDVQIDYVDKACMIDFEEWGLSKDSNMETRYQLILDEFERATDYPESIRRFPLVSRRFMDWMMGLPSCLDFPFYYDDQRKVLQDWGFDVADWDDEKVNFRFLQIFYIHFKNTAFTSGARSKAGWKYSSKF